MAGALDNVVAKGRAWWLYVQLDNTSFEKAARTMEALRDLGDASLPALQRGIRQHEDSRTQFRCAVVLHWLGRPEALPVLIDALRYGTRMRKSPTDEIVACLLLIGAPDATKALTDLWLQLPVLSDSDPTAIVVVGVLRMLHDVSALQPVCESSNQTPRLFTELVESFGTEALAALRQLAVNPKPEQRAMALRGLAAVPGYESVKIAVPMLYDDCAEVRELAPATLDMVTGPVTTLNALVEALRAGFTSASLVQMLVMFNPPELYDLLTIILSRTDPSDAENAGRTREPRDVPDAIAEAAGAFAACYWTNSRVTPLLCRSANCPEPSVKAAVARTIGKRGRAGDESDAIAMRTLWAQLTVVDTEARAAAAAALAQLGEPYGVAFESILSAARPQGNLIRNLQATLQNVQDVQDVGQAMTEAVQHVANWFNRVSRETAVRFAQPGEAKSPHEATLNDTRMPGMLGELLTNVLASLESDRSRDETLMSLSTGCAVLRTIGSLNPQAAEISSPGLRSALVTTKTVESKSAGRTTQDEVAGLLREAAGQAMIDTGDRECFELFSEALRSENDGVKVTGAFALGRLGDPRAAPLLQACTDSHNHELAAVARASIGSIKKGNPEMMTLLRGSSSADAYPDTLLRPTTVNNDTSAPELLLRPAAHQEP